MSILPAFRRIACGISGGVDSAVAAYLLKKKGFEVIGVFMKNWDHRDENATCISGESDLEDAKSVCRKLDINLVEVSFVKEYWNDVFSSLIYEYENGMTPNPDIGCNRFIKFGAFYHYAVNKLRVDAIATGHYAQTSFGSFLEHYKPNQNVKLLRAVDLKKDQTLFLSQVHQEPLQKTMFPLGSWLKINVRKLAEEADLGEIYKKKDSVGICFIGNRKFTDFIHEYIPERNGPFIDIDSKKLMGWHRGVHHWTLGQKCKIPGVKYKYYVAHRNPQTQIIFVCAGKDHPSLFTNELTAFTPHWIVYPPPSLNTLEPFICMFKFQHTEWTVPCEVLAVENGNIRIRLSVLTRAITPGQYAVFYSKDVCLGSAKISSSKLNSKFDVSMSTAKVLEEPIRKGDNKVCN